MGHEGDGLGFLRDGKGCVLCGGDVVATGCLTCLEDDGARAGERDGGAGDGCGAAEDGVGKGASGGRCGRDGEWRVAEGVTGNGEGDGRRHWRDDVLEGAGAGDEVGIAGVSRRQVISCDGQHGGDSQRGCSVYQRGRAEADAAVIEGDGSAGGVILRRVGKWRW